MLSNSERDQPQIVSYIKRKHEDLFQIDTLMALEQHEAPRYAMYALDTIESILLLMLPLTD